MVGKIRFITIITEWHSGAKFEFTEEHAPAVYNLYARLIEEDNTLTEDLRFVMQNSPIDPYEQDPIKFRVVNSC